VKPAISLVLAALVTSALLIAPAAATASTTTPTPAPTPAAAQISEDGVAPIAVLLDTSGSMNEDDGTGTMKLRGAKNAVRDIVRNLSSTTVFGLRTYPAPGGCDEGRYVYQPAPLANPDLVLSSTEGITADGSTPTGEALRALADDLKARGYTAATIVLVSDGESTCSTPPCDVANQLVQEGFDVTVPTIGFRTSEAGSEELACVSKATGGVYLNAGDSAELAEHLDSLVRAQLELTVRYDRAPMSGGSTRITASIAHKGGEDAKDVRLALTFADADAPETRRAAVPPMVRVGNIPAGRVVERSWVVGTGPGDQDVATMFTMSAWGTNAVRVVFDGEYTVKTASFSKDDFGDIFDEVSPEHPIVIFGDSYSSGEGVGEGYIRGGDTISSDCHRSHETYLGSAFSEAELKILACSGAVTSALNGTSDRAGRSQIDQLGDLGVSPSVGVMTFGGNNVGFEAVVTMCLNPFIPLGCADGGFFTSKLEEVRYLEGTLAQTYRRAWAALNTPAMRDGRGGAYAPLIVLAYPKVTWDPKQGNCQLQFTPAELVVADSIGGTLNNSIENAVLTVHSEGYGVHYVGQVEDAVRPDNTLCEDGDAAYINGWKVRWSTESQAYPESVHPKASGYLAITSAIANWSKSPWDLKSPVSDADVEEDLRPPNMVLEGAWPTTVQLQQTAPGSIIQGGAVNLQGGNLTTGSPATVTLHSEPVVLGTLIADENGDIDGTLPVPTNITPGQHTLVISALSADGEFIEKSIPVSVVFPTPWWVWGALMLGVVLLLGAAALTLVGLIRRRQTARG
jgi:hypothetical protein